MIWLCLGVLLGAIILYSWFVEPSRMQLTDHRIPVARVKLRKSVSFLFISDLHASFLAGPYSLRRNISHILRSLQTQSVEAILLGGDYVDLSPRYFDQVEAAIVRLQAQKIPIYAVVGNHDYKSTQGKVEFLTKRFEKMGVTVLINQSSVLKTAGGEVLIIGLDDLEETPGYPKQSLELSGFRKFTQELGWYKKFDDEKPELPRVVVAHNPDSVYMPGKPPEVMLAGHTHGGQYAFWDRGAPLIRKLTRRPFPKGSFLTWAGQRIVGHTNLIVSRGLGGSLFPARFLRSPQAHIITLQPTELPKHIIIGVSGKPRSGKDTVTGMLEALLPGITRSDFSHIMREEFDAHHGTNLRHDEAQKEVHRVKLTEFVNSKREIDPDYWIKRAFAKTPPLLMPSVRFPREIEAIKAHGGLTLLITSDHQTLRSRMQHDFEEQMKGKNESHLDNYTEWDYVIHNDGTLLDLEKKVRAMLTDILTNH